MLVVALLKLLRPKQWVKNAFVWAPLVFTGSILDIDSVYQVSVAFVMFCLASSSVYVMNDYHDVERDRKHPIKSKTRPIASGAVTEPQSLWFFGLLCIVLAVFGLRNPSIGSVVFGYLFLNLAYTFYLKNKPVLDIFSIAIGFVLRVYAGAVAIDVPVSSWMFVTTLCLALFLASIKRRQELQIDGDDTRKVLEFYTVPLVTHFATISSIGALLFYSLYVMTERPVLVISIPFVLFGFFRYWFLVELKGGGESPTDVLLSDRQLQIVIILWVLVCSWAVMGQHIL